MEKINYRNIIPVLEKHKVKVAVVYGSVYRGEHNSDSDIDIAVYLEGDKKDPEYTERYISLIDSLNNASDREVDVVDIRTCRESFANRIVRNSKVIYDPNDESSTLLSSYKKEYPTDSELKEEREKLRDRINKNL